MAIIPAEEKVFMVSNSTNTTYSGSAALKAMQQWYTMQDVLDSVGVPTLQQVTEAGNSTGQPIVVTVNDGIGIAASSGSGAGIQGYSDNEAGVVGISDLNSGVYGESTEGYGVHGESTEGYGGYFTSSNGPGGVYAYSESSLGITGGSNDGTGVYGSSADGYAIYGQCTNEGAAIVADGGSLGTGMSVLNGGVYIYGAVNPITGYQLSLSTNSAAKPSTNTWTITSDERVKTNVNPYTKGLEAILSINPITYDYNGKAGFEKLTDNIGIIAQDVLNIMPECINTYKAKLNEDDEEYTELYNFDSHALTFALINAVKELNEKIKTLEAK